LRGTAWRSRGSRRSNRGDVEFSGAIGRCGETDCEGTVEFSRASPTRPASGRELGILDGARDPDGAIVPAGIPNPGFDPRATAETAVGALSGCARGTATAGAAGAVSRWRNCAQVVGASELTAMR